MDYEYELVTLSPIFFNNLLGRPLPDLHNSALLCTADSHRISTVSKVRQSPQNSGEYRTVLNA